jgi:hypothetical protein
VLAGRNVRDGRREQVRARLTHEACALPGRTRLAVNAFRLLALVYLALDDALADLHRQAVDGRVVRKRQHVDGFHVARAGIQEALRDAHARDDAGHGQSQVGLERLRRRERARRVLEQQRRRADVGRKLSGAGGLRGQRRVEQQRGSDGQEHGRPRLELLPSARRARRVPHLFELAHRWSPAVCHGDDSALELRLLVRRIEAAR